MELFLAILIGFAILGGAIYYGAKKHEQLLEKGLIRKRSVEFDREAHFFTTSVDFPRLWNELNNMEYNTPVSYSLSQNSHMITYKGGGWEGVLREEGEKEGNHRYCFSFTSWKTRNGTNMYITEMNIFLTSLEKAFLRLDAEVSVATKMLKIKSKFF